VSLASMQFEQVNVEVVMELAFPVSFVRETVVEVSAGGVVTAGEPVTASGVGVFCALSALTENREERQSLAIRKVKALHVPARGLDGFEPQPQDVVTIAGKPWRVESSTPNMQSGTLIAHTLAVVQL